MLSRRHPFPIPEKEPSTKAYALAIAIFHTFIREYSNKVLQIVSEILKDEKFANSNDAEIKALHNYWMQVSKQYDTIEKIDHYMEFLHFFVNMPQQYMELPENKKTATTHFMEELLTKYGMPKVAAEMKNELKLFEEAEMNLKNKE